MAPRTTTNTDPMLRFFDQGKLPKPIRDLKAMSLFGGLTRRELRIVGGFLHERRYLKDEVIFDQGDEGQAIYLIAGGKVAICRDGEAERPIALLDGGGFFGELALLDDAPRSAQARAAEDCTLLVLFRGEFESLMHAHALIASKIALQLARQLGLRLRRALDGQP
jgi:CRP/FNR family cyclic AMP-dependent transcriptional regulator